MIAAWMLYTLLVGALLYAAAAGAEFVCRALRLPTRFVWATALGLTVALSANALLRAPSRAPVERARLIPASTVARGAISSVVRQRAEPSVSWRARMDAWLIATRVTALSAKNALSRSDFGDLARLDLPLAIVTMIAAVAGVFYLVLAMRSTRRIVAEFEPREVDGHQVLLSDDLGPALVGITDPRILLPRWVLTLDESERRGILAHEHQHARAADPAVAAAGAMLLALEPWNVALWALFSRLRLAIEADCDARVVRSEVDIRRYTALLLAVYERAVARPAPRLALVERRSRLEERIRRLAYRAPSLASARGIMSMVTAVALGSLACETGAPSRIARDSSSPAAAPAMATGVGVEPPCLRGPSGFMTSKDEKRDPLSVALEMVATVRPRHPEVFGPRAPKHLVLGVLLDEQCAVQRDTVVDYPANDRQLLATTFGDTAGLTGSAFFPSPKDRGPLVIFAVKPSQTWRERMASTACGFGIRFDEQCAIQGPLELRMLDSVRVLIAVRRFRAPNQPADHLFLVTLARPNSDLKPLSLVHAIVVFQRGAVYVEDFGATRPLWLFALSNSNGLAGLKKKREVTVFSDLVGVAHYNSGWLTLEQVPQLVAATGCDGPKGACFELNGKRIEFPA
jgi:beta-lactamase regulating signal transducer with metallopeptidase domain